MIRIEEHECRKLPGETSLFLFLPYNEEAINIIKQASIYLYDKKINCWELPVSELKYLLDSLCYIDDIEVTLLTDKKLPENQVKTMVNYKIKPFDHQIDAIKYGLEKDRWLLLDAPGLGKSLSIIYLAEELKKQKQLEHCLIICGINSLKSNWKKEIEKYSNEKCVILGEKINSKGTVSYATIPERADQLKNNIEEFFIITNIETLRDDRVIEAFRKSKNNIDMIVIDEIHKAKSKSSTQGKNILKLDSKYKIGATGTLIMNNPLDAYLPLTWIGENKSNLTLFKSFYCNFGGIMGREIIGFKNMKILKDQISHCSLRRTKDLLNLPAKNIIHELIDMNDAHKKFYEDIKKGVKDEVDKVELNSSNLLSLSTRLRQAASCPSILTTSCIEASKITRAVELAEEIISNGEKVVIYSMFKEPIYQLQRMLQKYNPLIGTGDVDEKTFSDNIDKFQTDDKYKVFIGTIQKMGTGITLTKASYAIFIDCSWTAAENQQAEDRIYRIGSEKPVFIYYLWCNNTLDLHIKDLVETKSQISDYMIDSKIADNLTNTLRNILENL